MQSQSSTPKKKSSRRQEQSADEIADKISTAILEHRLAPGTKLGEDRLASIFGTSRPRVREVLARLANEQVVELIPQRGAFVAKPTIGQAHDVFEARQLIEPSILQRLIANLDSGKLQRLQAHLEQETQARERQDARAMVRLSGEFHVLLAELAGNTALTKTMRELSTLTCLIISLYSASTATSCRSDEHSEIVAAIARKDSVRATTIMRHHLDYILGSLHLEQSSENVDLESIFLSGIAG
jgi:DNA-binding GntR family transcriptional regulator